MSSGLSSQLARCPCCVKVPRSGNRQQELIVLATGTGRLHLLSSADVGDQTMTRQIADGTDAD